MIIRPYVCHARKPRNCGPITRKYPEIPSENAWPVPNYNMGIRRVFVFIIFTPIPADPNNRQCHKAYPGKVCNKRDFKEFSPLPLIWIRGEAVKPDGRAFTGQPAAFV
jgi:hypothetical protein